MAAPGLSGEDEEESRLEQRGAYFHLIDTELRQETSNGGVARAVLRWSPMRRTADTSSLQDAASMAVLLRQCHPDLPPPRFDLLDRGEKKWWHWHGLDGLHLKVERVDGRCVLATGTSWVTGGFADLKQPRQKALRRLIVECRDLQVSPFGDAGEVCVPWNRDDLRPAVEFAAVYYKLLAGLGFFEEYRWHRRSAPASVGSQEPPASESTGASN